MTGYFDYHTQVLEHAPQAKRTVQETVQTAIRRKLSALCFTDHYPLPPQWNDPTKDSDCAMAMPDYKQYQTEVTQAIDAFRSRIELGRGAEVDWIPSCRNWTKKELVRWPFDYVIGSVHFIDTLLIDYTKDMWQQGAEIAGGIELFIRSYYRQVRALVQSRLFDGVGHLDLIKKFNSDNELFSEHEPWYRTQIVQTLDMIRHSGMTMEINTAGWEKPCRDAYPSLWIVHEAFARDIPITIGSDAHTPEKIGNRLADAVDRAKQAGYRKLVRYKHRQPLEVRI